MADSRNSFANFNPNSNTTPPSDEEKLLAAMKADLLEKLKQKEDEYREKARLYGKYAESLELKVDALKKGISANDQRLSEIREEKIKIVREELAPLRNNETISKKLNGDGSKLLDEKQHRANVLQAINATAENKKKFELLSKNFSALEAQPLLDTYDAVLAIYQDFEKLYIACELIEQLEHTFPIYNRFFNAHDCLQMFVSENNLETARGEQLKRVLMDDMKVEKYRKLAGDVREALKEFLPAHRTLPKLIEQFDDAFKAAYTLRSRIVALKNKIDQLAAQHTGHNVYRFYKEVQAEIKAIYDERNIVNRWTTDDKTPVAVYSKFRTNAVELLIKCNTFTPKTVALIKQYDELYAVHVALKKQIAKNAAGMAPTPSSPISIAPTATQFRTPKAVVPPQLGAGSLEGSARRISPPRG